jgi:phenylacetaldehyde dehydrogenase
MATAFTADSATFYREPLQLIDGEWCQAQSGERLDVLDPGTGRRIGTIPASGKADIDRAVAAARRTVDNPKWLDLAPADRAAILWRVSDLIEANKAELQFLDTIDNGMPLYLADYIVKVGVDAFRYYAGWATKIHGMTSDISAGGNEMHCYTMREPVGVAGLIVPWNGPFAFACFKLATALAAGCSCVLKPAEETSLSALRLGEILIEAGLPDGVVNIVTGLGETAGAALTNHPDVDKIGFTGSTEVGRMLVNAASGNLKKLSLELGGKSPVILFDDADLDKAAPGVAMGVFFNSGQICTAGSRVYVQRGVYDEMVERVAAVAQSLKVGNGFDPATQIGPLVSARQLQRVTGLIAAGREQGSSVVTGGVQIGDAGYFVAPTVLANSPASSRVMTEEIFGPVINLVPFDDFEEAIAHANATEYGLASAVWTRDISKAHRVARRIRAGTVWINCQQVGDLSMPYGGYKQSGWGREFGWEGIEAFLQTKSVFVQL